MNKTLIVGCNGNIATRYKAVFNYLNKEYIGIDLDDQWPDPDTYEQVLICTPTAQHIKDAWKCVYAKKRFLCEKPVSKNPEEIKDLRDACVRDGVKASMVNNWWWAIKIRFDYMPEIKKIEYNFYNTGNDGKLWDCIQPVYLANKVDLKTSSPVFQCYVNGEEITRFFFDASYVEMIEAWLDGNDLWTLEDALQAAIKVKESLCTG